MKLITVDWLHLRVDENTCARCDATGHNLRALVEALNRECGPRGVQIRLRERALSPAMLSQSNSVLINGTPIERILEGATASANACDSCCELLGANVECRTFEWRGESHETLPPGLLRAAICAVADCC